MTYIMLIRYKDGRDKIIEVFNSISTLIFPQVMLDYSSSPQTQYMGLVAPYQNLIDSNGHTHTVCIEEILDITIEASHEHRQDPK